MSGSGRRGDDGGGARDRRVGSSGSIPRNFLAPGERRRLFWFVMPAGVLLLLLLGWVERTWFPRPGAAAARQVDTRLEAVAGPRPSGDELLFERDPVPLDAEPTATLAADAESLARVRDATVFRDADNEAWFQVWNTLRERGGAFEAVRPRDVSFRELFGQPRSFRGRRVRMKGTLRRVERLAAPANDYGVDHYWQCWMEPAGGPPSPVVIQALSLPEGMPTGMAIHEPVEVTGAFFKNFAYNAADAIRVAPVIMTVQPAWHPAARPRPGALAGSGGVTLVMAALVVALVGAAWLGGAAARGRLWCLMLVAALCGRAAAADPPPPESLEAFLVLKEIAAADRGPLAAAGPWSEDKDRVLVRVLSRLPAPEPLVVRWRAAAEPIAPRGEAVAVADRLVRIRGRATRVAPRPLAAEIARLAARTRYDVVRLVDERGSVADVIVPQAPASWPRWRAIDEPVEVTGLPLTAGAGPVPETPDGEVAWPQDPADLVVAATGVVWHPATMLGGLGADYGLFDTIVDDRRLDPGDTAAFWDVLAAATRSNSAEIVRAAGGPSDVIALIDPARAWFKTHRGDPVVIDGVARRATRIAIDDPARRAALGSDHYWEVEVFADTPTIKVNDRIQDRYPIVCCVARLPPGMPTGESISERVRVPGFGFKRYRYPLDRGPIPPAREDRATSRAQLSTALVIAGTAVWRQPPSPAGASAALFGVFAGIMGLIAAAAGVGLWRLRRDRRLADRRRREALPDRIQLPGE